MEDLEKLRHSASHVLASAVKIIFPDTKFAIGPSIEDGFYYDFEFAKPITTDDLAKLEQEANKTIKQDIEIKHSQMSKSEAKKFFKDQPYKLELIDGIDSDEVSIYTLGDFTDLCSGPHLKTTGQITSFKLLSLAGAYWRGDEKNKMLTRIYGAAFDSKEKMDQYLNMLEEAQRRDHRKLGKELDLFVFSDLVGPGLPLFTPKGTMIKELLQSRVEQICRSYGFEKVSTPHLAKIDLYKISGHADKFGDELFHVSSGKDHNFVMKPVQCPHQTQIYASKMRSYKDLPIRYMESEKQYRAEKSGEVGGLNRVYAITVEDGHTFCRVDQVKQEIKNMVTIIKDFYTDLGMWQNHSVSLSVRDYSHPEKYIGDPKDWDLCEQILQEVSDEMDLGAVKFEGEAALYGPKLDFMFKDATGRKIQIPTVQIDFATPKRFKLTYINDQGQEENPVMVHRAILGSYERFMALLIEHFAGAFPYWLAPIQMQIIPVSEKVFDYSCKIYEELKIKGIRIDVDMSDETLGKKIRKAETQKIPYLLIVGQKEIEESKTKKELIVSVRKRGEGDLGQIPIEDLLSKIDK